MSDLSTPSPEVMDLATQIQKLLGRGLAHSVVASSLGCDPSYISQLMTNEDFAKEVHRLRASGAQAAIRRDDKWDEIEDTALEKAKLMLPMVNRPSELIRIAEIANKAKRTARELGGTDGGNAPTVNLILPAGAAAAILFKMNAESQVVEVEGRSMAPLPTKKLGEMIAKERAETPQVQEVTLSPVLPPVAVAEKKRVVSMLELIGADEQPEDVPNLLEKS